MSTPKALLKALTVRDGHQCVWHWEGACDPETLVPHHRSNRGMGGSRSKDRLSNLVWLCSELNGRIEADPEYAASARSRGIKISSHDEPSHTPLIHAVHGRCLIADDGSVETGLVVF